jgi:hypothetical protein
METYLSFVHRFKPGTQPGARPLLLLHGTCTKSVDCSTKA